MDTAIEILIQALAETTRKKEHLNEFCEETWNIFSPHGAENNGVFFKDITIGPEHDPVLDESKQTSSLERVHHNVDNLIEYARFVRSSHNLKIFGRKEKSLTQANNVITLKSSNDMMIDPGKVDQKLKEQCASSKNMAAKRQSKGINNCKLDFGNCNPQRYSHSCSSTLIDNVRTFKIAKDHLHILRQYHCFESLKNVVLIKGNAQNSMMQDFKDKCDKQVKVKLTSHLKMNINNEERYLKYLDLASTTYSDCTPILSSNSKNLAVTFTNLQYSSIEQLSLFELKYQHLLELQLQSEVLDRIINTFR